jgi:nicotinamidase-related amidase
VIQRDPARTALVVFDMLEAYRGRLEEAGTIKPAQRLIAGCRDLGVVIAYARADHRGDGSDFAQTQTDVDPYFRPWGPDNPVPTRPPHAGGSPGYMVIEELAPQPNDYDVPKHRWSAFHGTHLELSLRSRGVDSILLIGGSVHVGIASTAFEARDKDFQVTVVRDCCHGFLEQREFFMDKVFPRMCHVRTVDEVLREFRAD